MVNVLDLDDDTLLKILQKLDPLPDRFNAALACKRFRDIAQDSKLWIGVRRTNTSSWFPSLLTTSSSRPSIEHLTLEDAVKCSRPGDRIVIGPGTHEVAGVSIKHPLKLVGSPECQLTCRRPLAEAALEVWSNLRIEGLTVDATQAFCIRHHDGDLHLYRCNLTCHAEPLNHLYSALVAATCQQDCVSKVGLPRPAGSLTVEETRITGDRNMRAVLCQGDGQLQNVRVMSGACGDFFWFQVKQESAKVNGDRNTSHKHRKRVLSQPDKPRIEEERINDMQTHFWSNSDCSTFVHCKRPKLINKCLLDC